MFKEPQIRQKQEIKEIKTRRNKQKNNKMVDLHLNITYINKYIKLKWSKYTNKETEIVRPD